MQHFSQSSIFCVHPSAAAGLRQAFVNDRNGEILLCVTLPCIKETVRFPPEGPGGGCYVRGQPHRPQPGQEPGLLDSTRYRRPQRELVGASCTLFGERPFRGFNSEKPLMIPACPWSVRNRMLATKSYRKSQCW